MAELTATPVSPASDSTEERERRPGYASPALLPRARSPKRESDPDQQREIRPPQEKEHHLDVMA